jgi:uncharacterized protein YdcH (DUF465 family)
MSFGGSTQGMITALKNNRKLKSHKRSYFDKANNSDHKIYTANSKFKKATPEQLQAIREKVKKEKLKTLLLALFFFLIFAILFFYLQSF